MIGSKTIAIVVDNPKRDLISCYLLAKELITFGFDVRLIPMLLVQRYIFLSKIDYILFNYCRVNNISLIKKVIKSGRKVGILDTEGGVFTKVPPSNELDYFNNLYFDNYVACRISNYFVWGYEIFNALREKKYFPEASIFLTGTPRVDLFAEKNRPFYDLVQSKSILVNFSFSLINPKFNSFENEFKNMVESFNFDPIYLRKIVDQQIDAQKEMINAVSFLSARFPERKIVVRPHPFENENIYRDVFKNNNNVSITNSESIESAILKSSIVLHFESSTALEAACLGVVAVSPQLEKSLRPIHQAEKVTIYYKDHFHLANIIENTDLFKDDSRVNQVISDVFFKLDGMSSRRIASHISEAVHGQSNINIFCDFIYYMFTLCKWFVKKILKIGLIHNDKKINKDVLIDIDRRLSRVGYAKSLINITSDSIVELKANHVD